MEALVAIGLAGNVVQFVQFAGELISQTDSIRNTGSPSSLPDLRNLTENLTKQADSIQKCLSTNASTSTATLAQEDQYLINVAADCQKAGTQFLSYLDTLISRTTSSNRLKSVGVSIKFQFAHHKIEDFASKLDRLRSSLTLATLLAFRASSHSSNEQILTRLKRLQPDQNRDHAELQGTIRLFMDVVQSQTGPKLDSINTRIQECLKEIEVLQKKLPLTRERAILTWLNFRQMPWRYEEIPLAYQQTFRWIFEKPPSDDGWDDFSAHLRGNATTPYFINGKAGSGKSTLMKYVVDHPNTEYYLAEWAATERDELIVAKFFFWNLGTSLQKSTLGLLRALLSAVLHKHPEFIPAVFPDVYQDWKDDMSEPSYAEVKRAWKLLIEKSATFLKIAIFIDGIDEFEGDHKDVSEFIYSLASPKVKVVVSSRPINACLHVFRRCPALRLQDITMKDMQIFVEGNLVSHQAMAQMAKRYPSDTREVVSEIKEKAEGVFLWVRLVVKLLVDGLESGDSMEDLRKKLRSLPRDLRDIYRRMISKISLLYQVQAAEIFQLLQTWQSVIVGGEPFKTILLHFALERPSEGITLPIGPLDGETLAWYHQQTAARIRSRCCGLVEIPKRLDHEQSKTDSTVGPPRMTLETATYSSVNYLHRTVAEFLMSDDVSKEMHTMTGSNFDPHQNIISACLSLIKISGSGSPILKNKFLYFLNDIVKFYRAASPQSRETLNDYITALDETMTQFQNDPYEGQTISIPGGCHWSMALWNVIFTNGPREVTLRHGGASSMLQNLVQSADIFTFTARLGFYQYLKACYREGLSDPGTLVLFASNSWSTKNEEKNSITLRDRGDTLLFILQHVESPDAEILGESLFSIAVRHATPFIDPYEELSLFWASFITTARSPESLIRSDLMRMYNFPSALHALKTSQDPLNQDLGYKVEQIFARMRESDQLELQQYQMLAGFETMTIGNRAHGLHFHENEMWAPYTSQDNANAWTQLGEQYRHQNAQRFDMALNSTMYKSNPFSLQERNAMFSPLPLRPYSTGIASMQPLMQQFPIQDPPVHQFIPHQLSMQQFPMPNPPLRQFPMHQVQMQQPSMPYPPMQQHTQRLFPPPYYPPHQPTYNMSSGYTSPYRGQASLPITCMAAAPPPPPITPALSPQTQRILPIDPNNQVAGAALGPWISNQYKAASSYRPPP